MSIEKSKGGKIANPEDGDRSGNTDKLGNKPSVNQGISNAGPTGNRNDRADKAEGNNQGGNKGKGSNSKRPRITN